ncbi:hypothetical protein EKL30_08220 [Candidimonas sp. SYP-B2681]|uniref:hypothetical protein n=1 Tax=Candidimonas sp. SYP-B2681 TaxID=2497686 RepID=UPI000F894161|nr:hypothetical protein [Candidimonas sp. SYP-B2681]RTZ44551.1 hypothetical protein EKL30_08220 [Candidimonas sp. SYP-B2681]
MKLLTSLWHKQKQEQSPNDLLNSALDVALDFNNWLSPIQNRLKERHRSLTKAELDALNQT